MDRLWRKACTYREWGIDTGKVLPEESLGGTSGVFHTWQKHGLAQVWRAGSFQLAKYKCAKTWTVIGAELGPFPGWCIRHGMDTARQVKKGVNA